MHRFRIAQSRQNVTQSEETRNKISTTVTATKRLLKRQRLAARAAEAAQAATADLKPAFSALDSSDEQGEETVLDAITLEKAVIEVTALRRQLTAWMNAYETSKCFVIIVFIYSSVLKCQ